MGMVRLWKIKEGGKGREVWNSLVYWGLERVGCGWSIGCEGGVY